MKQSLYNRIYAYHKKRPGVWIPKGEILRLVLENTKYTADNAGRRLRELAEDGKLQTKLVRGHAHYSFSTTEKKVTYTYDPIRDVMVEMKVCHQN